MFEFACMNCKQPWEQEHVRENVSNALVKRLSQSTQKRLRDEEIAFMPETQMYIEYGHGVETVKVKEYLDAVRTVNDLTLDLATHQINYEKSTNKFANKIKRFKIDEQLRLAGNHASDIRVQISRWRNGIHLSPLFKDIIPEPLYVKEFGTQAAGEQVGLGEKESHVMCPCPAGECRGFVTRRKHQCGVCGVKVCHRCLQAEDDDDDVHRCEEENLQSAELILATTKPCPKCASRIHKIEGCDQMWCTNCNTPFSWKSGKEIVGQTIHNPHFYEWTRQQNAGQHIRRYQAEEEGFNNCEGLPDFEHVSQHLDVVFHDFTVSSDLFVRFVASNHQRCVHMREVETRDIETQFRTNLDVRLEWLQNELTDKQFEKILLRRHNKRTVQQSTNQVYGLVVTLCSDVFHRLLRENGNTEQIRASYITEFEEIGSYANTCLCKVESLYKVHLRKIRFVM